MKKFYALIQIEKPRLGCENVFEECFVLVNLFEGLDDALSVMRSAKNPEWFMVMQVFGTERILTPYD